LLITIGCPQGFTSAETKRDMATLYSGYPHLYPLKLHTLSDVPNLRLAFPEPLRTLSDLGVGTISSVEFSALVF
jgi:hypothetical protein